MSSVSLLKQIYCDLKFIVQMKECFWTKGLCCSHPGGLVVFLESHSPEDCGLFVHKHLPPAVASLSRTQEEPGVARQFVRRTQPLKVTLSESTDAFASIAKTTGFLSQCYMIIAHTCEKCLVQLPALCCRCTPLKGGNLCEGTRSLRHCQSSNDETITAY